MKVYENLESEDGSNYCIAGNTNVIYRTGFHNMDFLDNKAEMIHDVPETQQTLMLL